MSLREELEQEYRDEQNYEYNMRRDYDYFLEYSKFPEVLELLSELKTQAEHYGWDFENVWEELKNGI